jgi:hypothetical protein
MNFNGVFDYKDSTGIYIKLLVSSLPNQQNYHSAAQRPINSTSFRGIWTSDPSNIRDWEK